MIVTSVNAQSRATDDFDDSKVFFIARNLSFIHSVAPPDKYVVLIAHFLALANGNLAALRVGEETSLMRLAKARYQQRTLQEKFNDLVTDWRRKKDLNEVWSDRRDDVEFLLAVDSLLEAGISTDPVKKQAFINKLFVTLQEQIPSLLALAPYLLEHQEETLLNAKNNIPLQIAKILTNLDDPSVINLLKIDNFLAFVFMGISDRSKKTFTHWIMDITKDLSNNDFSPIALAEGNFQILSALPEYREQIIERLRCAGIGEKARRERLEEHASTLEEEIMKLRLQQDPPPFSQEPQPGTPADFIM